MIGIKVNDRIEGNQVSENEQALLDSALEYPAIRQLYDQALSIPTPNAPEGGTWKIKLVDRLPSDFRYEYNMKDREIHILSSLSKDMMLTTLIMSLANVCLDEEVDIELDREGYIKRMIQVQNRTFELYKQTFQQVDPEKAMRDEVTWAKLMYREGQYPIIMGDIWDKNQRMRARTAIPAGTSNNQVLKENAQSLSAPGRSASLKTSNQPSSPGAGIAGTRKEMNAAPRILPPPRPQPSYSLAPVSTQVASPLIGLGTGDCFDVYEIGNSRLYSE